MFKQMFAIALIAMLCFTQSASAIKCYQCKSLTDPNCAKDKIDSTSNIRQVECDEIAPPTVMDQLKPVTRCNKVKTSDKAGVIISRDCHFEIVGQKENVCTVSHSREVESCFTCKGDLCNASGASGFMVMSVAALLGLVAVVQVTL